MVTVNGLSTGALTSLAIALVSASGTFFMRDIDDQFHRSLGGDIFHRLPHVFHHDRGAAKWARS